MGIDTRHDAPGQLSGYLYQVLAALLLLLQNENPQAQLCIEKFDDVAFVDKDTPYIRIQTKHQLYKKGSLIDTSVDLWRTLKSWCDAIIADSDNLNGTDFIVMTTASSEANSAASYLNRSANRDYKKALSILLNVAQTHTGKTNAGFYNTFKALGETARENLVKHIYVYDNSPTMFEIKKHIMPYIRCATIPVYEEKVYEKVLGWWINAVIQCLSSEKPTFINRAQLQFTMFDIGSEYKADSLPIDVDAYYEPTDDEIAGLSPEKKIFIEQLKLISLSNDRLKRCIKDYYNAYCQRSIWVREQLRFVDELSKYEAALIDEWNRLFLVMKEELEDYGNVISEAQKEKSGKILFGKIEDLNYPIRERVTEPFIMRGTFHELANKLKVGWHVDFWDRLCHLLGG